MKRSILAGILALAAALSLTACGASSYDTVKMETTSAAYGAAAEAPAATEEADYENGYDTGGTVTASDAQPQGQKLIRTAHLEMETTDFDTAVASLEQMTAQMDGYFENSSIANRKSGARWAEYTIRVPAEKYELYLSNAGKLFHVTWQESSQDDISETYYDTQGRLATQQIKLERLQELLAQAEAMEDIIAIESAISETEWNIESLSGTLRHYDGKVDYATVYLNLQEVYKLSNTEEVPDSFGSRMLSSFRSGISDFVDTLEDLAVSFAYSWIWWLLTIAVVLLLVRVWRKKDRRIPKLRWKQKHQDDGADK